MPKEVKKTNKKNISNAGNNKRLSDSGHKVYIIYHFQERFEMDEYRRQGGLDFIRMFVTQTTIGKSNESTEFFQQLKELRYFYPEMYYSFYGIFWTLGMLTATREDWLRGYLLDGDLQPLSEGKLAARLQIGLKETRAALNALKRVGLIEHVPCPEFEKPKREKETKPGKKKSKGSQTGKDKPEKVTTKKATTQEHSETFGNISKPLNNKNEIKTETNNKANIKTDFKRKEQNKEKQSPENMQAEAQRQKEKLLQAESDDSGRKPVNPLNPMDSDETAVSTHYVPKPPSSAFRDGKIIHIGNVLAERFPEHWSDADAESFGWEIVEALGYSTDRENVKSRAEWGSFASWWKRVKQTASQITYQELRTIANDKAVYVRTKAKSAKNKSAVWFTIMNKELLSRGITLPDSRASPA